MRDTVTEELRQALRGSGQTQIAISHATGIHPTSLSQFINGHTGATLATVQRLAAHLKLELKLVPAGSPNEASR